jgi:hypothetical protein
LHHCHFAYQNQQQTSGFISDFIVGGSPKDLLKVKHTLEKIKGLAEGGQ